ncbi:hypothetical protein BH10PSE13_BH10PSE13_26350 [soil metagenome]
MTTARILAALLALTLTGGPAVHAQPGNGATASGDQDDPAKPKGEHQTEKRAGEIVTQPVHDVGIDKKKVPLILETAVEAPYAAPRGKGCPPVTNEMASLNEALGPDFGQGAAANENKLGAVAAAGGSAIVNTLIPFRGLVREISGAAPAERRLAAAVSAGMARRGYLHGIAQQRGCRLTTGRVTAKKK